MPYNALFIVGAIFSFLFGITVGSFLNVCIYRLPAGESIVHPPSHCPRCNTRLRPADLFPLLSYLALHGKCRYCKTPISPRYFTIEFITGLLFAAFWWMLYAQHGGLLATSFFVPLIITAWAFAATMLVIFMIDLDTTLVIEAVTWIAMAAGLLFELLLHWGTGKPLVTAVWGMHASYMPAAVPGMIIGFLVFILLDLFGSLILRKPSMGVGDAYIGAAIGSMLGPYLALLSFGMAVALGAVLGIILLSWQALRARGRKPSEEDDGVPLEEVMPYSPLRPFLIGALVLCGLWIAEMYLGNALATYTVLSPVLSGLISLLFGAAVIAALILLGPLWMPQTMETDAGNDQEPIEEMPQGNYMPFGPFLTACAVVIALAPNWFVAHAIQAWHWWVSLYG